LAGEERCVNAASSGPESEETGVLDEVAVTRQVTRDEVRRVAFAVGANDPIHHDVEAARAQGYPDLVAPIYFFASLGMPIGVEVPVSELGEDGLPLTNGGGRRVAGTAELRWSGEICAGDEVVVRRRRLEPTVKQGRSGTLTFFPSVFSYLVNGEVVVEHRAIGIGR
jgi:acyl dehydratase